VFQFNHFLIPLIELFPQLGQAGKWYLSIVPLGPGKDTFFNEEIAAFTNC
jgi:hypothetical protein